MRYFETQQDAENLFNKLDDSLHTGTKSYILTVEDKKYMKNLVYDMCTLLSRFKVKQKGNIIVIPGVKHNPTITIKVMNQEDVNLETINPKVKVIKAYEEWS